MKILQINNFHYLRGGSERVYLETVKLLKEKGHKVICFSTKNSKNEKTYYENFFVSDSDFLNKPFKEKIKLIFKFFYSKEAKQKLEELIIKEKPNIAHLHIFYGRLTSSILPVLRKYKIPTVMTVHEYKMLCPMYTFLDSQGKICENCAKGNYYHCILKKCNRNNLLYSFISALECYFRDIFFPWEKYIDKFIMVSQFILKKHLQYKPHIKNKAIQIYNFIDLDNFTPDYFHKGYYLYFGRLSREKGLLTLLKAWKDFPKLKLKIVGTGEMEPKIKAFIQRNKMLNVKILGFKNGEELKEIIKKSMFVIIPSEWYENNPLSVIESLSLGKPIIGSNIGGIPELIKDGFNGFLFKSGDVENLKNSIKRAESITKNKYFFLSKNARKFAEENFSKERYYTELIKLYSSLVKQKEK